MDGPALAKVEFNPRYAPFYDIQSRQQWSVFRFFGHPLECLKSALDRYLSAIVCASTVVAIALLASSVGRISEPSPRFWRLGTECTIPDVARYARALASSHLRVAFDQPLKTASGGRHGVLRTARRIDGSDLAEASTSLPNWELQMRQRKLEVRVPPSARGIRCSTDSSPSSRQRMHRATGQTAFI